MTNLLDLSGKTAIIFGGTGALGSYIVKKLYDYGAKVVFTYYDNEEERAQNIISGMDPSGERSLAVYCNVTEESAVAAVVSVALEKFGTVDIAVNTVHNPAFTPKDVANMSWGDWQNHLDAQKGHFLICKHLIPPMRKQQYGRIIYLSGGLAVRYMGGASAFSAVKSGLTAMCRTMAYEEGKNNITINIVAPGKVTSLDTDGAFSWDDAELALLKATPLNRFATEDDVANAVLYFASPLADAMTGQILYVACGEIMR